jgi:hypothetical protein
VLENSVRHQIGLAQWVLRVRYRVDISVAGIENFLSTHAAAAGEEETWYASLDADAIREIVLDSLAISVGESRSGTINLREGVIPDHLIIGGTQGEHVELKVRVAGEQWCIHRNDADPFPSSPHAHNYPQRLKLHLGNGDLYRGRSIVGNVGRKALERIRNKISHVPLPPLE